MKHLESNSNPIRTKEQLILYINRCITDTNLTRLLWKAMRYGLAKNRIEAYLLATFVLGEALGSVLELLGIEYGGE